MRRTRANPSPVACPLAGPEVPRSGGADADSVEDLAERRGGAVQRQITDVEVSRADVDHRAQRSRADINRRRAGVELTCEPLDGNRQEVAQGRQCSRVRAAIKEDPEDAGLVDRSLLRVTDEPFHWLDVEVADDLGKVELRVEVLVADERHLFRGVSVGIGPSAKRQPRFAGEDALAQLPCVLDTSWSSDGAVAA